MVAVRDALVLSCMSLFWPAQPSPLSRRAARGGGGAVCVCVCVLVRPYGTRVPRSGVAESAQPAQFDETRITVFRHCRGWSTRVIPGGVHGLPTSNH